MIVPMLIKVDFGALHRVAEQWRGIAVTVGINWLVKPFSMAILGWLLIGWLFRPLLPAVQIDSYIAGLILLAAAPCTAMVFVWSNLTDGEPNFTLTQVALNDTIMVFAFAPIVRLLLGLSFDHRSMDDVAPVGRPLHCSAGDRDAAVAALIAGARRRVGLGANSARAATDFPLGTAGDTCAAVRLSGRANCQQPLIIALLAVPIVIQVYLNAGIAYSLNRALGVPHNIACPSALIGASNFFELAVAALLALLLSGCSY